MRNKRVLVLSLGFVSMLAVVACGNKETDKKASNNKTEEVVQSEVEDDKADVEEGEEAETAEDSTQSETPENTQSDSTQSAEPVVTKTTMYAKSNVNIRSGAGTSNAQTGIEIEFWAEQNELVYGAVRNRVSDPKRLSFVLDTLAINNKREKWYNEQKAEDVTCYNSGRIMRTRGAGNVE